MERITRLCYIVGSFTYHFEALCEKSIYPLMDACPGVRIQFARGVGPSPGPLSERLAQRLEQADFVVADVSERNPNVFLELGLCWAHRIPLVLIVEKSALHNVPSIFGGHVVFTYSTDDNGPETLRKELAQYLCTRLDLRYFEGRQRLDPIFTGREYKTDAKLCFVIMPFSDDQLNRIYEGSG